MASSSSQASSRISLQHREADLLVDAAASEIKVDKVVHIDHAVGHDLEPVPRRLGLDVDIGARMTPACCRSGLGHLAADDSLPCLGHHLAGHGIGHRAGQGAGRSARGANGQLFVVFIAALHGRDHNEWASKNRPSTWCLAAFHRRRLARTQLLVYLEQSLFACCWSTSFSRVASMRSSSPKKSRMAWSVPRSTVPPPHS